ncbi:hypothetical protein GN956_G25615 [Arapaima gigas]
MSTNGTRSSMVSADNLLNSTDEFKDFIENIKQMGAPFALPPKKRGQFKLPSASCAMPVIKEDTFERMFDSEEFQFGLMKKRDKNIQAPGILGRVYGSEAKSKLKAARTSVEKSSILLQLHHTHGKDQEEKSKELEDNVKEQPYPFSSRLGKSEIFFSLLNSSRAKMSGDNVNSALDISKATNPLIPVTETTVEAAPSQDGASVSENTVMETVTDAVHSATSPPLTVAVGIQLPDHVAELLPQVSKTVTNSEAFQNLKPSIAADPPFPNGMDPTVDIGIHATDTGPSQIPSPLPAGMLQRTVPTPELTAGNASVKAVKGFHTRPGKIVIYEQAQFSGKTCEVFRDLADATSLKLSPVISVRVIRGCWILYEKPGFEGRSIALEEGPIQLRNVWAEQPDQALPTAPMVIGSIRLAVKDYTIPHIDLFSEPRGLGRMTSYFDATAEIGSFPILQSTASIKVHSGVWLVYSEPGFEGLLAVLDVGEYPCPESWGFPVPFVCSLRPLRMGGLKVENPNEVKALLFEKPGFEGPSLEVDGDLFSFSEKTEKQEKDSNSNTSNTVDKALSSVGSLKIFGGLWVGYEEPGFEGQQCILEEGEYVDWRDWGGRSDKLLSLRPVVTDFLSPHAKMYSEVDFDPRGISIDLVGPVFNLEDTGYGTMSQSIDVMRGV